MSTHTTAEGGRTLEWVQRPDGEHNGSSRYQYTAIMDGIKYHIVWATGAGFGYSIAVAAGGGRPNGAHYTIVWRRSLKKCKAACEEFAAALAKTGAA